MFSLQNRINKTAQTETLTVTEKLIRDIISGVITTDEELRDRANRYSIIAQRCNQPYAIEWKKVYEQFSRYE